MRREIPEADILAKAELTLHLNNCMKCLSGDDCKEAQRLANDVYQSERILKLAREG